LDNDKKKIKELFENLKRSGFTIKKEKVSANSIYSELEFERTSVRLEATFQKISGIICDYELSDGNYIAIYSLAPDSFIIEKINTYLKRLKVRDLWDIFFLIKNVDSPHEIQELGFLIKNYKKPIDEQDLKIIILEGIVPSPEEMIGYIKRKWENKFI
jgi:predicted nucleotidyltransferase component of viral defense system